MNEIHRSGCRYLGELPEGTEVAVFEGKMVLAHKDCVPVVVRTANDAKKFCDRQESGS